MIRMTPPLKNTMTLRQRGELFFGEIAICVTLVISFLSCQTPSPLLNLVTEIHPAVV